MATATALLAAVNLGCELLFVLQQRLGAQRVPTHTALAVLTDIIEVLLNEQFLKELEECSQIGKHTHMKQLMEDIASVSVMRLDKFSMDKLWELMVMVFKWQLTIIDPDEIFVLTRRHLQGVAELVKGRPVEAIVKYTNARIIDIGRNTSEERKIFMRNSMLLWLNDYNTKVSLLLRLGFQRNDGSFVAIHDSDDEKIINLLKNPGSNIYSYEYVGEVSPENKATTDPTEIKFLCREILGESDVRQVKFRNFTHNFLRREESGDSKCKNNAKVQCEFEVQSCSTNRAMEQMDDLEFSNEQKTLHEDLLSMLDEDMNVN